MDVSSLEHRRGAGCMKVEEQNDLEVTASVVGRKDVTGVWWPFFPQVFQT